MTDKDVTGWEEESGMRWVSQGFMESQIIITREQAKSQERVRILKGWDKLSKECVRKEHEIRDCPYCEALDNIYEIIVGDQE